ncbi:hypothetical protein Dimus_035018 [Dionaea muscipula]
MLSDAEKKQVESQQVRGWLEKLRSVVYDADDLFDEFNDHAHEEGVEEGVDARQHSLQREKLGEQYRLVKKLDQQLDIVLAAGLGSRETYSFVAADQVIGREEDKKAIVEMLMLDSTVGENISVVLIVGMGGLGKTTLAQLVFNDDKIEKHFENPEGVEIDKLQKQLREIIGGKKYLLVLDDLWNENPIRWRDLENLLMVGSMGSKILLTTRSRKVAKISVKTTPYDSKGLSEGKSRSLFERVAFEPGHSPDLVEVGKEIVKKCANVPLAIITLGGLLYGQEESVWLSFKENELPKIPEGGDKHHGHP